MGKVKGIFASNITGKVGNVVFRQNGKQNIVSQRPANVKNPRSNMQQMQRAYIKTVACAYSVLQPICDHSYEGVSYGGPSMNFFNKENYRIVSSDRKAVTKNSSKVVVNSAFLVSKGSISWNESWGEGGQIADISKYMADNKITDISTLKYSQLLEALGINRGDQLTIMSLLRNRRVYMGPNGLMQKATSLYYTRYIFESEDDTTLAFVSNGADSFKLNSSILSTNSETNWEAVLVADNNGHLKVVDRNGKVPYMHTAIISRKIADKWLRSTASLYTGDTTTEEYNIEKVLPSYSPSGERYLNNAED